MDYNNLNPTPVLSENDRNALKWVETGAKICHLPKTEKKCRNILNGTERADKDFMEEVRNAHAECGCFVHNYRLYLKEAWED